MFWKDYNIEKNIDVEGKVEILVGLRLMEIKYF